MENTSLHDPFYVKEDFFRTVLYLLLEPRPAYFLSYPAYLKIIARALNSERQVDLTVTFSFKVGQLLLIINYCRTNTFMLGTTNRCGRSSF